MNDKIQAFGALVESEQRARMAAQNSPQNVIDIHAKVTIKSGQKYTKVDVGTSGKYMVEMATGNIFGIKGYGQVHKGHFYGTVDTTAEFSWGEYYPERKATPLPKQSANWSIPKLTFAPEPVKPAVSTPDVALAPV